ncbi:MAG: aminotransferase class V-fold PLP-dependent enzyme [Actinomycetota bacterium]|nr:aminotransferase class V-fold PLP-dependent enzyme [Actinomycetota bacterium]
MEVEAGGNPLHLGTEAMRALGYRTVDMLVERLSDPSIPPLRRATPEEMRARLSEPPPSGPHDFGEILERLRRDVLPFSSRGDHPGFLAFIPFAGTWPGALGDFIASACNIYAGSWMESAGPSQLELEVLDWFKDWIGFPSTAGGVLLSGGSTANMTALACAREALVGAMSGEVVGYVGDQAHSSLGRAARILGFRPDQLRVLPTDSGFCIEPRTLAGAVDADSRAGRRPLFLSASAGATNTGAIDPLPELAALCRDRGIWFHVDAAYGGFAALTDRGRAALRGIELADSVTLDPHKWLYQPYECGALLVREDHRLRAAFEMTPDYLQDAGAMVEEVNFSDRNVQLTRSSRAIKVWVSLQYFGADAFRAAIDRTLDLAGRLWARIEQSEVLELTAPPSLGVVCFRRRSPAARDEDEVDRDNADLVTALERSGLGLISSTVLHGRYSLRICVLSPTTAWEDLERVVEFLERTERTTPAGPEPASVSGYGYERDREMRMAPIRRRAADAGPLGAPVEAVADLPLFAALDERQQEGVAALARITVCDSGETIVKQWDLSLDFHLVVEGCLEAEIGGIAVNRFGPGDFFGELAALDWGAGFGYPRTASVRAVTETTLLTFPVGSMNDLLREHPSVARQVRQAAAERLNAQRP